MKSQAISAPASTVAVPTTAAISHRTGSLLFVARASFHAAIATIAYDGGADGEEDVLHGRDALVAGVDDRYYRHDQKGRDDEWDCHGERTNRAALEVPKPHREL